MSGRPVMMQRHAPIVLVALIFLATVPISFALEFDMVFQTKCVYQDVAEGEEIEASYEAFDKDNTAQGVPVSVKIEDPEGDVVFTKQDVAGSRIHIEEGVEGDYKICFTAKDYTTAQSTRIALNWQVGAAAHDWEAVAKRDHLDSIQTEMARLEAMIHTMHLELQHIRVKEMEMRDVNETINSRIAWFSVMALLTCVGFAGVQLWSLRRFFLRKKLL